MGTLHNDMCKLEIFQTKVAEKVKALILYSNCFPKILTFVR